MSPANVYRFFESKKAIHQAVARGLMGEVELEAQRIVTRPGPVLPRFRELLTTIHRMNTERYVGDNKLHEMVAIAMEEDWDVCVAHIECCTGIIGEVIAQGVASGEFEAADLPSAALCTCTGMIRFFHPQMIAQAVNKPSATIDEMIDFLFRALEPRKGH
jgi:AcrR family transcriptional regulator